MVDAIYYENIDEVLEVLPALGAMGFHTMEGV
jgi:hypothetical protein